MTHPNTSGDGWIQLLITCSKHQFIYYMLRCFCLTIFVPVFFCLLFLFYSCLRALRVEGGGWEDTFLSVSMFVSCMLVNEKL